MPKRIELERGVVDGIVVEYLSGASPVTIGSRVGVSAPTVSRILAGEGVELRGIRDPTPNRPRYRANEDIFLDLTREADAYWLGMMLADGTVDVSGRFRLALKSGDVAHVEAFAEFCGNFPVHDMKNGGWGTNGTGLKYASVGSVVLTDRLIELGVVPAKGRVDALATPAVPDSSARHFWRGVVDGDGCIYRGANTRQVILYGNRQTCLDFKEFLAENGIRCGSVLVNKGKTHRVTSSGSHAVAVAELLYGSSTVALPRKLKKALALGYP